ncbi:MAG: Ig-like domain repeat protein [Nakamurella sp.]
MTLTVVAANHKVPHGRVDVRENGHSVGVVGLDAKGNASYYLPANVSVGYHRYYGVFLPSSSMTRSSASSSVGLTVVRTRSSLSLTLAPRLLVGAGGFGTVTVRANGLVPAGNITVYQNDHVIYRTVLAGGAAKVRISPTTPVGRNDYKFIYSGNASTLDSSASQAVFVTKRISSVSLSASATLASFKVNGSLWVPVGSASVSIDGHQVSVRSLAGGRAGLAYAKLAPGTHTIRVSYPGDGHFNASTASVSVQVVAPQRATSPCSPSARACVDLTHNLTWLQENGRITYGPVSMLSGRPGYRTETGTFSVYWKDINHHSSIFDNAPMPYAIFFDGGTAFHEGSLYVESHGCVHLSSSTAQYYWSALDYGDTVQVFGYAPY